MYTTLNSLNDIRKNPDVMKWLHFLFSKDTLDFFPEEYADDPLRLSGYRGHTSWGQDLREMADQLADAANLALELETGRRACLRLKDWEPFAPSGNEDLSDPDTAFLITPETKESAADAGPACDHFSARQAGIDQASSARSDNGQITSARSDNGRITSARSDNNQIASARSGTRRPCVIICPGGGYEFVSFQNEGTPIQTFFEQRGFAAFILRYRVAPSRYPDPQMDLLRTIRYVRDNADRYGIDPDRICVTGFSAAGHLAASCAALCDELLPGSRPDALVLGYPVITMKKGVTHEGSFLGLTGGDESMREALSCENLVGDTYPPTFVWACEDDGCVPCENTRLLDKALTAHGIRHEAHLYPTGGHGCGLAFGNSAWSWSRDAVHFLRTIFE